MLLDRRTVYDKHVFHRPQNRGLALSTVNGFVRAIRAFSTWLWEEGYIGENVFKPIRPPKVPKQIKQPLSEEEMRLLLDSIPKDTPEGARNYAIILLFLDCGLRLSELVNLKLRDINFNTGEITVMGRAVKKGGCPSA